VKRAALLAAVLLGVARAEAQACTIVVDGEHGLSSEPLLVSADRDDDDEDGVLDAEQPAPPADDLCTLSVRGDGAPLEISVAGPLALIVDGKRTQGAVALRTVKSSLAVQGLGPGEGQLRLEAPGRPVESHPVEIAALSFLDAHDKPLDARRDALGISRHITHDRALPRGQGEAAESDDPDNVRIELDHPAAHEEVVFARLEAHGEPGTEVRVLRHVPLQRIAGSTRFRSPFLRLVSDATDAAAPEVSGQLLRVRLRDRVEVVVERGLGALRTTFAVGRPGRDGGPRAALRGRLRITVLRTRAGGAPVLGADDAEAIELARSQIEIANEIWAQCFIGFGDPAAGQVRVVNPPPPALLAIGDVDGLPARGGGVINFRAGGQHIGPISTIALATPEQTARSIARALAVYGLVGQVTVNPRTEPGAGASADVVVRNASGELVGVSAEAAPLSTDVQQRIEVGRVDLLDGIQEFDNALAATGTLEERALVKLLADDDPTTIDVFLINHFVNRDRQGEAFIEADGSSMANVLVFDRNAVRYDRQAWVQAHELGHVLLDEAFHPDSVGTDRPWLLMDSDAQKGRVTGPKRLRPEECARVRRRSGPSASPPLLLPAP
jgi:hypothetical protein